MDSNGDECDNDDDNDGLHDVLDDCQYGLLVGINQIRHLIMIQMVAMISEEDSDDDNDGILDIDDNCPTGVLSWVVDNNSDLDNDGCRDIDEDEDDDRWSLRRQ